MDPSEGREDSQESEESRSRQASKGDARKTSFVQRLMRGAITVTLDSLRRHSVCFALTALLATYLAKIFWYIDAMERSRSLEMGFLAFIAFDLFFWATVVAISLSVEMYLRKRWLNVTLLLVVVVLAVITFCNVFYLLGTGSQVDVSLVRVAFSRFEEIIPIIAEGLETSDYVLLVGAIAAPVLVPFLFKEKWKQDKREDTPQATNFVYPLILVLLGALGLVEQRAPQQIGWRLVAANVHVSLLDDVISEPSLSPPRARPDPAPTDLPIEGSEEELPNIIVFIMEATALRATSLSPESPPTTPFLARLAAAGLQATSMRAVMPHTSKSLFSILCGVLPGIQTTILETADNYPARCLPHILSDRGYATAFMQSADGRFEQRPRLVANLGFENFVALQDIQPRPPLLGYLAADDGALIEPSLSWAQSSSDPFFLVLLTSATHHPYELPPRLASQFDPDRSASQMSRYTILIRAADAMAATIVEGLDLSANGRPTIIVIMGDHGEAFGEHGRRQHDNVFFEEGLRVPFVIYSPGRVEPGTVVSEPSSLIDVTPTILGLAGIPFVTENFDGRSLLSADRGEPRRNYFACWYDGACAGYVLGDRKFVSLVSVKSWIGFDLGEDPAEMRPQIESPEDNAHNAETRQWYLSNQYSDEGLLWTERSLFGGAWECREGRRGRCASSER